MREREKIRRYLRKGKRKTDKDMKERESDRERKDKKIFTEGKKKNRQRYVRKKE